MGNHLLGGYPWLTPFVFPPYIEMTFICLAETKPRRWRYPIPVKIKQMFSLILPLALLTDSD